MNSFEKIKSNRKLGKLLAVEFEEFVTLELLAGRDWQNLSSEILMIDLEIVGGEYQLALEWVSDRVAKIQ